MWVPDNISLSGAIHGVSFPVTRVLCVGNGANGRNRSFACKEGTWLDERSRSRVISRGGILCALS